MQEFRNKFLRSLPHDARVRLSLKPIDLPVNHEMEYPGSAIANLFFLESGMASMTTTFLDGAQAEIAMAGIESAVGSGALVGVRRSLNRVYMQIAGTGYTCSLASATDEFRRFGIFHDLCLRSLQAQFIQSAQTAGCNARHSVEQRLARWLLLCANRTGSPRFNVSQEFMADMLGNSRPTVSVIASQFQAEGLIIYQRSHLTILDPEGLERRSCECFRSVLNYLENYLEWDSVGPLHSPDSAAKSQPPPPQRRDEAGKLPLETYLPRPTIAE